MATPVVPAAVPIATRSIPWWLRGFALETRSLALFRIALGLSLLAVLLVRLPNLRAFYTRDGILPAQVLTEVRGAALSLNLLNDSLAWQACLFVFAIVAAVSLTVGYRTRLATILAWALLTSFVFRNPLAATAGDHVLRLCLFWGIFLPLDGWLAVRRSESRGTHLSVASVALLLQFGAIYWLAFAEKMDPAWLTDRTALYDSLQLDWVVTPIGVWVRDHIPLSGVTVGTLTLELLGPFLAISPWRTAACRIVAFVLFVGFHLGIGLTMRLGTFPWVCAAAWIVVLPLGDRAQSGQRLGPLATAFVAASVWLMALNVLAPADRSTKLGIVRRTGIMLGWEQRWPMFAPHPPDEEWWYIMEGVTRSGERVNVWSDGPAGLRPTDFGAYYRDAPWLAYLIQLPAPRYRAFREPFAHWLCRTGPLDSIVIRRVTERTPKPGEPTPEGRVHRFYAGACPQE